MDGSFTEQPVRCERRVFLKTKGKRDGGPNNWFGGPFTSDPNRTGTEVQLTVPAHIAFQG